MNYQPQYNPLAPEVSPTAEAMLNSYRDRAAALRGETAQATPQSFNPFQPQEQDQQQSQEKHVSKMEQWLAPVKLDSFDPDKEYTEEKHENFMKNAEECPARREYGDQLQAYLDALQAAEQAGQITRDEAKTEAMNYYQNYVVPVIHKHYKDSKTGGYHRKREPEIPEIVKKVRGAK
ncbi:hypothetical protein D8V62_23810 [Salmonella enterica]|nr:hypothetical protein [Salmonella enterica]